MKEVVMSFLMVFLCESILAQENLVPNGSFEDYTVCPTAPVPWTVSNWARATLTPDYFNACISYPHEGNFLDTPCNNRGCQVPHSGDAYAGLFAFDRNHPDVREFIQVELLESLVSGIRYLVEFYVSPAEKFGYAVSTLGAALTVGPPPVLTIGDYEGMLDAVPQVVNNNGPITDTTAWTLVRDTVLSRGGGERFISIGNFHYDTDSDTLHFNPNNATSFGERSAYYYIDDVSVVALDSVPNSVEEVLGRESTYSFYPNPNSGEFTIELPLADGEVAVVEVYGLPGERVFSAQVADRGKSSVTLPNISPGIYAIRVTVGGELRHSEKLIIVR